MNSFSEKKNLERFSQYIESKINNFLLEKNTLKKIKLKKTISAEIDVFIRKNASDKKFKIWANFILKTLNS